MVLKDVKLVMIMVSDSCQVSKNLVQAFFFLPEIRDIAQLLDLDEQILFNCLTKSGTSWLQIENGSELDAINANVINKALCRTLYGRLFTFVVNRINESLKVKYCEVINLISFY